ncbi:MAG: energy-coupling factor transporter transmembrane protein EcfT [Kineosporiaceae bacterium]|nr:energy-coupling factor transporter transmembrane protein EcfT [Kineosporiaceae bacterium]
MIGLYVPGDSFLHRAPAGVKLLVLAAGLAAFGLLRGLGAVVVAAAVEVGLALAAGLGPRTVLAHLRPLRWILIVIGSLQAWLSGWQPAVVVCGSIVVAVLGASLVTLTTRTEDLLTALERGLGPARHLGVRPDRVALVLALVVRAVPVLSRIAGEVHQARAARGAQRSMRAFAVPFVIRSVRYADRLGEALAARGVDD